MSKKDNGAPLILAYLNERNRPYSAQDVFTNLQKQHGLGKTAVVKAMELLALEGKIKEKTYGKQKIYFADQAQFKDVKDADLKAMDGQISELTAELQTLTQSCRQLEAGGGKPVIAVSLYCTKINVAPWLGYVVRLKLPLLSHGIPLKRNVVSLCLICPDRDEGAHQLPHHRRSHFTDPRAENSSCRPHSTTGEDKVSHKSRHTRGEGEGLQGEGFVREGVEKEEETGFRHDEPNLGRVS